MIENIVFDVGRVLVHFSYDRFFVWMRDYGATVRDEDDFIQRVGLLAYERGEYDDDVFLDRLSALLTTKVSRPQLTLRWNDLFVPLTPMLDLAGRLMEGYGVFLFSNTSGLHWDHLQRIYNLPAVSHGLAASFELGAMKPAAEAFRRFEARFGLRPETTVLIDDRLDNVEGAMACGWHGIHHRGYKPTCERLQLLGIKVPPPPQETA